MLGQRAGPEGTEVYEPPYPGFGGGGGEAMSQLEVASRKTGPAGHGVHQVVGGLDAGQGVNHRGLPQLGDAGFNTGAALGQGLRTAPDGHHGMAIVG
jgi:hypothetical protein